MSTEDTVFFILFVVVAAVLWGAAQVTSAYVPFWQALTLFFSLLAIATMLEGVGKFIVSHLKPSDPGS